MRYTNNWTEYELLDTSDGERLERWGKYILVRPDPQVIWKGMKEHKAWKRPDAVYARSKKGGGAWNENKLPEQWNVSFEKLDWIFHSVACRSAIKAGNFTSRLEMERFAKQLLSMPDIRYCPHGRPVLIEMTKRELEKNFGRV